jgi:glyoxylase I family protein
MEFSIKHLDHVVVRVSDLDRAVRFYSEVLGCTEERRSESSGLVQLRAGRSLVDLMRADRHLENGVGNMDHFALRIEPFDEPSLRSHLERYGVKVGPVVFRSGADGRGPSVYIQDPEGNTVELKGPPES